MPWSIQWRCKLQWCETSCPIFAAVQKAMSVAVIPFSAMWERYATRFITYSVVSDDINPRNLWLQRLVKCVCLTSAGSEISTCWKHCITTPRQTLRKFWVRPPVNSSRREGLACFPAWAELSWCCPNDSIITASRIASNVCLTLSSEGSLSSRADIIANASAGRPAFNNLFQDNGINKLKGFSIVSRWLNHLGDSGSFTHGKISDRKLGTEKECRT